MTETNLESFVGNHVLTGVDMFDTKFKDDSHYLHADTANCIRFRLDGITYIAMEDPEDGYRSCLGSLFVSADKVKNTFPPCEVICVYRNKEDETRTYSVECDIIRFIDKTTGLVVLEIGTTNTDDYYPSFVGIFNPQNMAVNQGR